MLARDLLRGSAIGEVVQRKRFARNTLGALQWVRVTMIGKVRGSEHHEPIEHRQNLRLASSHVTIPELKMTAILLAPILVQVEQQIEAPVETVKRMLVEVSMDCELTSPHDLVKPAPVEAGIGYEVGNSCYAADKFEERDGIQVVQEKPSGRAERRLGGRGELDLAPIVKALPSDLGRF